ncbi:glycosyltransferase [Pelomicrobium sp.]|uniref:glycosyltransferase n=1 Tax=Pelomicrobium sp. TaxID=2815319 RepID=UPI002FDDD8AE
MKKVLMIAFHFPPLTGSSGIHRTLNFVRHLPTFGWSPLVLTAHPRAYEAVSDDQLAAVPPHTLVERAFALNTARHLSLWRRYPAFLARPDRWVSWWLGAVPAGLRLIRRHGVDLIWSTYPIATAHLIGATLAKLTGLPWVADFRDPMAQDGYPSDPKTWQSFKRVEERVFDRGSAFVFVTPGAARMYQQRYPGIGASRVFVVENGYDEETFAAAEAATDRTQPLHPGMTTLLHSGVVYPSERNPEPLLAALGELVAAGRIDPRRFRLRFRAAVHEALLRRLAAKYSVESCVELLPPVPYREALAEMLRADALLILQSRDCNEQIPAKLYEYLRCAKPVLALTDPEGDTANLLRRYHAGRVAPMESKEEIARALPQFLAGLAQGTLPVADAGEVKSASRFERTRELARVLDEAASTAGVRVPAAQQEPPPRRP